MPTFSGTRKAVLAFCPSQDRQPSSPSPPGPSTTCRALQPLALSYSLQSLSPGSLTCQVQMKFSSAFVAPATILTTASHLCLVSQGPEANRDHRRPEPVHFLFCLQPSEMPDCFLHQLWQRGNTRDSCLPNQEVRESVVSKSGRGGCKSNPVSQNLKC